jgi:uncharacterized protein (UPF0218 family)
MLYSLHVGDVVMAVLLPLSLILLVIVSNHRHERRAIAKRRQPRVIPRERRTGLSTPSAPISNVIALRAAPTKAMHQRRRAKVIRLEITRDR